jgi:glucose-6-phosphate 1-dehydrogenase
MIEFRDPGSISERFLAKAPGPGIELREVAMTFKYDESFGSDQLEAYERLLYDAMMGDQTLFTDAAGIERLWELSTPLLDNPPKIYSYPQGSWGPPAASRLIAPRNWCLPEDE